MPAPDDGVILVQQADQGVALRDAVVRDFEPDVVIRRTGVAGLVMNLLDQARLIHPEDLSGEVGGTQLFGDVRRHDQFILMIEETAQDKTGIGGRGGVCLRGVVPVNIFARDGILLLAAESGLVNFTALQAIAVDSRELIGSGSPDHIAVRRGGQDRRTSRDIDGGEIHHAGDGIFRLKVCRTAAFRHGNALGRHRNQVLQRVDGEGQLLRILRNAAVQVHGAGRGEPVGISLVAGSEPAPAIGGILDDEGDGFDAVAVHQVADERRCQRQLAAVIRKRRSSRRDGDVPERSSPCFVADEQLHLSLHESDALAVMAGEFHRGIVCQSVLQGRAGVSFHLDPLVRSARDRKVEVDGLVGADDGTIHDEGNRGAFAVSRHNIGNGLVGIVRNGGELARDFLVESDYNLGDGESHIGQDEARQTTRVVECQVFASIVGRQQEGRGKLLVETREGSKVIFGGEVHLGGGAVRRRDSGRGRIHGEIVP